MKETIDMDKSEKDLIMEEFINKVNELELELIKKLEEAN